MSDSGSPIRRRRIAGETKPAGPAKKATAKKVAAKPVAAPKVPTKKVPTKKGAVAKIAPMSTALAPEHSSLSMPKVSVGRTPKGGEGQDGPSRRDLRWLIPTSLLAIATLVVGALFAFNGVSDARGGGADRAADERQAAAAAGDAAETIFSYRFDQLEEHLADSKALMTPKFAKDFDKIAPALGEVAPQRKVQVEAVTRNAAALGCGDECSANTVNVLVFLDQARLVDGSKQPDVIGNRITVSMVKRDGTWLVNDIRAL